MTIYNKKLIILISAALLLVLIGAAAFFLTRVLNKVDTLFGIIDRPKITSMTSLSPKKISIEFISSREKLKTIKVYGVSKRTISKKEAIKTALAIGFKTNPEGKSIVTWKEGKRILRINLESGRLDYQNQSIKPVKGSFSKEKLAQIAEKFLNQKGLSTKGLNADTKHALLFEVRGTTLYATNNTSNPVYVDIGFNRKLGDYTLFYQNPTETSASVMLNKNGQVFKAVYHIITTNKVNTGIYPVTNVNNISPRKIKAHGILVHPQSGNDIFDPNLIRAIIVEDYFLGYLDDQKSRYLQPIYVLRGVGEIGKTTIETVGITIYFPALEETWLK